MCLATKQKRVKIAKEDMTVYKILLKNPYYGTYTSPYQYFDYNLNELYETEITKVDYESYFSYEDSNMYKGNKNVVFYEKGFHAFLEKRKARKFIDSYSEKVMKCVIPRGSRYYTNKCGHIVSNKLIVLGKA